MTEGGRDVRCQWLIVGRVVGITISIEFEAKPEPRTMAEVIANRLDDECVRNLLRVLRWIKIVFEPP